MFMATLFAIAKMSVWTQLKYQWINEETNCGIYVPWNIIQAKKELNIDTS